MNRRPLSLSDQQMHAVQAAARPLLPSQREAFLENLARCLDD
jgi:hypothetical protein